MEPWTAFKLRILVGFLLGAGVGYGALKFWIWWYCDREQAPYYDRFTHGGD